MGKVTTVLITGITGYLGRNLATYLLDQGYNIVGIIRESSDIKGLEDIQEKVSLYSNATRNNIELAFENHDIDIIIHTATSYGRLGERIDEIVDSNILFPSILLDIALKYPVSAFINTDTALPNINLYALTKYQFKEILKLHSTKLKIVNLRLEYFFGPSDKGNKFVTYIIGKMVSDANSIELSEGTQIRDFIYIEDVLQAYLTILSKLPSIQTLSEIPVGLGQGVQLRELVFKIKAIAENNSIELDFGKLPMRNDEVMESIADISILKSLGWQPRFTLEEGLIKTFNIDKNGIYK